jgi:putative ABC transport system permease protein
VRRREELGLLRSLGATRSQVFALIFGEVILLGGLGVILGLPLGYAVAQANVETVSATLSNLYMLEEITRLEMTWWLYALGVGIGVGGAMAGALVPALDMSRRDPRALLSTFTLHERVGSLSPRLVGIAFALMALAGTWYAVFGQRWKPAGFVLGIALLFALPLLVPFLLQQVCGRLRLEGFKLSYSLKGLAARLQTTAFAVASLAVAVSMLIGITLMVGSFRRTLESWIGTSIQADIYVASLSWRGRGSESGLAPDVLEALRRHPSVRAADRLRGFLGYADTQRVRISGVHMDLADGMSRFPLLSGDAATAYRLVRTSDAVFIGETLARKMDIWTGDVLSLHTPDGVKAFPVVAVYYDYSTEGGAVAMDLQTMARAFGPGPVNSVALYLHPQLDPEAVVDQLKAMLPQAPLTFTSNQRLRAEVMRLFDQTFAVTHLLQWMSLLIAVCGIALMLLVLAREQIPELALYRSLGATRRQLFRLFVGKGLGMGMAGLCLGFIGGVLLAAILIYIINRTYFGWTIQPYIAWGPIAQQAATILGAAVLASLYPALRASRTPATELSRDAL